MHTDPQTPARADHHNAERIASYLRDIRWRRASVRRAREPLLMRGRPVYQVAQRLLASPSRPLQPLSSAVFEFDDGPHEALQIRECMAQRPGVNPGGRRRRCWRPRHHFAVARILDPEFPQQDRSRRAFETQQPEKQMAAVDRRVPQRRALLMGIS